MFRLLLLTKSYTNGFCMRELQILNFIDISRQRVYIWVIKRAEFKSGLTLDAGRPLHCNCSNIWKILQQHLQTTPEHLKTQPQDIQNATLEHF